MQNSRFLFFGMIIGACFVQSTAAMELVQEDGKKDDIAINMRHLQSDAYHQNISQIKNLDLQNMRLVLEDKQFLPAHSDDLQHLLYLSTIKNNNTEKTLFTQRQQNKFDACFKIQRSVPWVFGINGVIIVGASFLPFVNFTGLSQCFNATQTECFSQVVTIVMPTVSSVVESLAIGLASLWATGLAPHIAARSADEAQDQIWHLRNKYATIVKHWIDIYFDSPEEAEYIADKFDIEALRMIAQLKTYNKKSGGSLVDHFEEAWLYIKRGSFLKKLTEIENYIRNKISCRLIEAQSKKIELLEAELENLKSKKDI